MKRVTGIGGVFFKAKDGPRLRDWYQRHLGIPVEDWGGAAFKWRSDDNPEGVGTTVWTIMNADTGYLPGIPPVSMVNYRVADLKGLLEALRAEGCDVDPKMDETVYGKFGWLTDPEGNRIELWEPPAGQ